jgi:hypothetical protein
MDVLEDVVVELTHELAAKGPFADVAGYYKDIYHKYSECPLAPFGSSWQCSLSAATHVPGM